MYNSDQHYVYCSYYLIMLVTELPSLCSGNKPSADFMLFPSQQANLISVEGSYDYMCACLYYVLFTLNTVTHFHIFIKHHHTPVPRV